MGLKDLLYAESMLLLHRHTMAAPSREKGASVTKLKEPHSLQSLKQRRYLKELHGSKPSDIMLLIQFIKVLYIRTPPYMVLKQMNFSPKLKEHASHIFAKCPTY